MNIVSADADKKRCEPDQSEVIKAYEEIIKSNIEYDALIQANKFDEKLVQGIFELILETVVSQSDSILIASEIYPAAMVKSKFLKAELHAYRLCDQLHEKEHDESQKYQEVFTGCVV